MEFPDSLTVRYYYLSLQAGLLDGIQGPHRAKERKSWSANTGTSIWKSP